MRVLLTVASLLPAYGGPARSVSGLAENLSRHGLDIALWAPDGSAKTTPFLSPESLVQRLACPTHDIVNEAGPIDVFHDNGIWLPHNHQLATIARRNSIPRVVSLRGMLEPWAFNHKWLKKRVAWYLYQRADLMIADKHHATSAAELQSINRRNLGVAVELIPNGIDLPDVSTSVSVSKPANGIRTALFVGRIYPVKGLPMLIDAWAQVHPAGWRLRIVGPDEAGHRAEVEHRIQQHQLADAISFAGPLNQEDTTTAYQQADLFVLPSFTENFGMAIGEAMAHGLPVLTTKGTPWSALVEHNCGWWVEANVNSLVHALREATSTDVSRLTAMGIRGRTLVRESFNWQSVAARFVNLYHQITRSRTPVAALST